ncbi:MAG: peptide chain release factor 2 [Candidatus Saccharibacteria bacterium]
MEELIQGVDDVRAELDAAFEKLHIDELEAQNEAFKTQMAAADFWTDTQKAQEISKQQSKLEKRILPWLELREKLSDIAEFSTLDDTTMQEELASQLDTVVGKFAELREELKFSGPYDDHDVILGVYAGAGGTDAQDWAQMLLRMYVRWAESHDMEVKIIDESAGDEAGIKSATLEISGPFAYGKLKSEHGVHRLVRLSPYNAESRETSFAKVDILPMVDRPEDLEIDDKDLRTDVYRSGGHGGQSVNTTDSAVRITHIPTGISVAIQNERSQLQNKETALTILRSRLIQLQMEQHQKHLDKLKGPNQSAEWGNQIRSYVLHPYKQVKDLRTRFETSDVQGVLGGDLDPLINAYLNHTLGQ